MQFLLDKKQKGTLFQQAYEQLLIALHTGKVRPGSRLPSVRQVALSNKINIKSVFAVYQQLQAEGYVTLRIGSGAYVDELDQFDLEQAYYLSLLKLIKSHLSEAQKLKLDPQNYSSLVQKFIDKSELGSISVGVIECNEEQIRVFAKEISDRLHVRVLPLLLEQLESPDGKTAELLEEVDCFATTDFHFKQVKVLTAKYQKKLLQLRLNPHFIPTIIEAARQGRVLMIVSNADYFPAFRHRLLDLSVEPAIVKRISAVDYCDRSRLCAALAKAQSVYISAICEPHLRRLLPPHLRELKFDGLLSSESIEALEAVMLFLR